MKPRLLRHVIALAAATLGLGAAPAPIPLWPGEPPGEKGGIGPEKDINEPKDGLIAGRPIIRLTDVSRPTLTLYRAPAAKDTGATVVVFPGGGYYIVVTDLEGTEVCAWLNSIGVNAVLLKYRVPRRAGIPSYAAALQDAQRAVGLVRSNAREWGIDPRRVGTLGFSAGGDLSAVLSAHAESRTYPRVDAADDLSCRPDFQLLIYPAYLVRDDLTADPSAAVNERTPPTFLVMAQDDPIHVENVLVYATELQRAKVPMELHVYPTGKHGYGLRPTLDAVTTWPARAADWMRGRGLLTRN
jgi:acetyl esterase/lipase